MSGSMTQEAAPGLDAEQTAYFRNNVGWLRVAALARFADSGVADDLVQDTFIRLFGAWPTRREAILSGKAYARRTLMSQCTDHYRRRQTRPDEHLVGDDDLATFLAGQEQRAGESVDVGALVNAAVDALPAQQGEVIRQHYFEGLSLAEVAEKMRIGSRTVHNYHRLAKMALAKSLSHLHANKEATP